MRNYWKLNRIDGLLCAMPWVLEVEVVQENPIFLCHCKHKKGQGFPCVSLLILGSFFFSIFLLCWVKPKGQEIIKIRGHEAGVRSLPN